MMALHCHLVVLVALLLTVQIILTSVLVEAANTNFSFSYFNTSDSFLMIDDVVFNVDNSSFTMNSMNAEGPAVTNTTTSPSRCGRLLYNDKVRMKDSASGAVASFHTAFTFQITGPAYWISGVGGGAGGFIHGDGLAFTFARNLTTVGEDAGGSLCLLNASDNGMASNRLFAVEFDTFRNLVWNDSSDSHIGVNLNSLNSTWSYNLCHSGTNARNCSYLCNGGYFTAWIDYDSTSQKLQVFFDNGSLYQNIPKPPKPLIEANLSSLSDLVDDYIYVGFSSSTGGASEVHQIQSWRFTSSGLPDEIMVPTNPASNSSLLSRNKVRILLAAGIPTVIVLASLVALGARFRRNLSFRKQDRSVSLVDQNLVPRMFTNKELSKATKDFSRSKFLGSGGFGAVYQGSLPSGALVAVKRMRMESKQGKECFQAEVASLSNIRHRNLVQLRGWCHEEDQLLLVYDYMCNGSLDKWLFPLNEDKALPMQLNLRHSVLSGVAAALAYLHEECEKCVLHRDIKSSNVLLDGDWNAYLGDFGLARLIDHQKLEKTTAMAGTFGYMAPEMPHTWKATKESDVYSFGVLVLEVMCGRRALEMRAIERGEGLLVDRVWRAHEAGSILEVADARMEAKFPPSDIERSSISSKGSEMQELTVWVADDVVDPNPGIIPAQDGIVEEQRIRSLLHLGLLCCNPNPENRPSMRLVSQLLQSSTNMEMLLPPLPRCKPQVHYLETGFSETIMSSQWSLSYGPSVEETVQGSDPNFHLPVAECVVGGAHQLADSPAVAVCDGQLGDNLGVEMDL